MLTFAMYLAVARKPVEVGLIYRKLYPCVGHGGGPVEVTVNFGQSPFRWKGAERLYREGVEGAD